MEGKTGTGTITILADHNIEGQTIALRGMLDTMGWLELVPMQFVTFAQVGLPVNSNDRTVWRFAQENGMILLTGNRRMTGEDSLERTIREENQTTSLPVLTIGNLDRLVQRTYRERCANRLVDIVVDLEDYLGTPRIFIP